VFWEINLYYEILLIPKLQKCASDPQMLQNKSCACTESIAKSQPFSFLSQSRHVQLKTRPNPNTLQQYNSCGKKSSTYCHLLTGLMHACRRFKSSEGAVSPSNWGLWFLTLAAGILLILNSRWQKITISFVIEWEGMHSNCEVSHWHG